MGLALGCPLLSGVLFLDYPVVVSVALFLDCIHTVAILSVPMRKAKHDT